MEACFEVETSLGPFWLWGRDTGRPLLVVVNGAFAAFGVFDRLQNTLPDVDVLRCHLPGNHCPPLLATNVGSIGRVLSSALDRRFPNRRSVLVGLSTGALVALAARPSGLTRLVLVEPFLRTAHVWVFREMLALARNETDRALLWNILGVSDDATEDRNYTHLAADVTVKTTVLVGSVELGFRSPYDSMPSLVDDIDRGTLEDQPLMTVSVVEGAGHNVPAHDMTAFFVAVRSACDEMLALAGDGDEDGEPHPAQGRDREGASSRLNVLGQRPRSSARAGGPE